MPLLASVASMVLLAAVSAQAGTRRPINVPAGTLEEALSALAAQTGDQLLYSPEIVAGRHVEALHGDFDAETALARLLRTSDIVASRAGPKVIVLKLRTPAPPASAQAGAPGAPPFGGDAAVATGVALPGEGELTAPTRSATLVEEIRVTGSHIRGGTPAAPIVVIGAADLARSGHATVAAALNVLPQNYSGENTEATVATRATRLANNLTFASGINLRGLGPSATLVLLDGRRLSGAGNKGDFVDLSLLPTIAVARVEVVLDGASALYGSDAVGGVVNIRMRRDVDGGEVRLRAGTSTGGGAGEAQLGLLVGRRWSTGNAVLAYEGFLRDSLSAASRSYTRSADLRPYGGSDFRSTSAFPGNIVAVNPATGVSGPFYGIPAGQAGTGLTAASFTPGAINLTSPQSGIDILPDQRRHSLYGAFRQELTGWLELSGDLNYSDRAATSRIGASTSTFTVGRANPYFVSPTGAASHSIAYSFSGILPAPVIRGTAESLTATLGAKLRGGHDWSVDGYAGYAEEADVSDASGFVNTAILAEALGNVVDNPATAYSPTRDGYFNPFSGLASVPASIAGPLGSGYSITSGETKLYTANLQADGPVFRLPGGEAKLALGANARRESFGRTGTNFLSTATPGPQAPVSGRRTVKALFAEVLVPLVGEANALPGVHRLEVSGALRWEDYSDFGRTLNPKVGLVWSPRDDVRVRATYGESFRAPGLGDLYSAQFTQAANFPVGAARVLGLVRTGGNPGLEPETARSWTTSVDYNPAWAAGLRLSASWFDIHFKDRVDRPVSQNLAGALTDTRFVDFVRRLTPATDAADLALVNALLAEPAANNIRGLNPTTSYLAVVDNRAVNTSALSVRGLDVQATYGREVMDGRLNLALNASRLFEYSQALTPTSPSSDLLGLATYPARLRGRSSLDWTRGALSLGGAVNYTGHFRDAAGARIKALATLDLQARLAGGPDRFSGAALTLTVRNAFDTHPPFYNNPFGYAFDPGNADVIGRFVAVQVSRTW